ncbi:hypothetical protein BU17DRAFT_51927 [Hysterangium stoloniferum]|nr:hypothetical protein BU17DRAFT_51927 [Hysterangium stoloniferum]
MLLLLTLAYLPHFFIRASPLPILSSDGIPEKCTCLDQRTVWDIIWSCLATIIACSWVSVHPNIPEPDEAWCTVMLRRMELMFWAIIAPEMVIYWAVRQWDGARRLKRKYRRTGCVETDQKWTVAHGHFIQMGGFMLFDKQGAKGTLSPERFAELLGEGKIEFPAISEEEIQDRSKGDPLSKSLVIVQTSWFIIQCIARKAQGLDTTQMELLTLALATLNGVTYFLWWDKPLDVRCPVPVQMLETRIDPINLDASSDTGKSGDSKFTNISWSSWFKKRWTRFCAAIRNHGAGLRRAVSKPLKIFKDEPWIMIPWIVLFRWPNSARHAILIRFGEFTGFDQSRDGQMRVPLLYALARDPDYKGTKIDMPSPVLATVFGAIHCVGWSYIFPTNTETLLWRVCSILVTAIPSLCSALFVFLSVIEITENSMFLVLVLLNPTLPVYILARLSLLVEAVISLRALPAKAYANVEWTSFLPHI